MDLMYENYEMIYFSGRHAMERTAERIPVQHAKVEIGSTRGTSSHHYNPAVILCEEGAGETHGSCIGACLVYSGNFVAAAQKDQKTRLVFRWVFIRPISASIWKRRGVRYPAGNLKLFRNRPYQTVTAVS